MFELWEILWFWSFLLSITNRASLRSCKVWAPRSVCVLCVRLRVAIWFLLFAGCFASFLSIVLVMFKQQPQQQQQRFCCYASLGISSFSDRVVASPTFLSSGSILTIIHAAARQLTSYPSIRPSVCRPCILSLALWWHYFDLSVAGWLLPKYRSRCSYCLFSKREKNRRLA